MNHNAFFFNLVFVCPLSFEHFMACTLIHDHVHVQFNYVCVCGYEMSTITNSHVRCDVESERTSWCGSFEVDEVDERPPELTKKWKWMKMRIKASTRYDAIATASAATAAYLCPFSAYFPLSNTRAHIYINYLSFARTFASNSLGSQWIIGYLERAK